MMPPFLAITPPVFAQCCGEHSLSHFFRLRLWIAYGDNEEAADIGIPEIEISTRDREMCTISLANSAF